MLEKLVCKGDGQERTRSSKGNKRTKFSGEKHSTALLTDLNTKPKQHLSHCCKSSSFLPVSVIISLRG